MQLESESNVFDLACSTGRVLRHFACPETGLVLWGAEQNGPVKLNGLDDIFQKLFGLSVHHSAPSTHAGRIRIPAYAFSVFTHIDEFELAWLAELRRVFQTRRLRVSHHPQ